MRVSKSKLAKRTAARCGINQRSAAIIIDAFLEEWKNAITDGDVIEITHFLSMRLVPRARRPGGSLNNIHDLGSIRLIHYDVLTVATAKAFRAAIKETRGRRRTYVASTEGF